MSTRSVDRSAVAHKKDRSVAAHLKDRSASASRNARSAAPQKDRSSLCTFTFADGRRCRTPRYSGHLHLCFFHARKEAQARAAEDLGRDISYFFSGHYLSACDLSIALGRVFTAAAQGHIKTRTAARLAYLAQVLVQVIQLAQHEYIEAVGEDPWRDTIYSQVQGIWDYLNQQHPPLTPQPPPSASSPTSPSQPISAPPSSPQTTAPPPVAPTSPQPQPDAPRPQPQPDAPRPQPQPAPAPKPAPKPPASTPRSTSSVVAGPNSSRPGRETGSSPQPAAPPQPQLTPAPPTDSLRLVGRLRDPEPPSSAQRRPPRPTQSTPSSSPSEGQPPSGIVFR